MTKRPVRVQALSSASATLKQQRTNFQMNIVGKQGTFATVPRWTSGDYRGIFWR